MPSLFSVSLASARHDQQPAGNVHDALEKVVRKGAVLTAGGHQNRQQQGDLASIDSPRLRLPGEVFATTAR